MILFFVVFGLDEIRGPWLQGALVLPECSTQSVFSVKLTRYSQTRVIPLKYSLQLRNSGESLWVSTGTVDCLIPAMNMNQPYSGLVTASHERWS